jgi:hypothetical protein
MHLLPFHAFDEQLSLAECRTMTLLEDNPPVPADEYGLVEHYCSDPKCDCRRVMLSVFARASGAPGGMDPLWV